MVVTTGSVLGDRARPHGHAVAFYDADRDLTGQVADFMADGLIAGGSAVVVATAAHRHAIDVALSARGAATAGARATGRYVALDATTTLAEFTAHGDLDEEQFDAVIGGIVTAAAQHGTPVRIFGEMVALLWAEGDVAGAMELESFWNRLAERHDYSLMCAYPQTALDAVSLGHATDVCQLHSQVHALGGQHAAALSLVRDADVHTSRVLVPTASSVRAARHFTTAALGSWAEPQIVENAALIATELAANAVKHAGSAFRVTAARLGTRIRITVEDTGPGRPQLGSPGPFDVSGRGLALTAALAEQWGWQGVTGGKEVWAELPLAYQ